MRGQPARHQVRGHLEINEMSQTKGDQGQAIQNPRNAHAIVADDESEASPVPVSSEPGIEDPGCCRHHRGLGARPPGVDCGRDENEGHSQN